MDQPQAPTIQAPTIPPVVYAVDDTANCRACPLWETSVAGAIRRSRVYGRGTGQNGLMVIAEALGEEELIHGTPLVGRAGQLFSQMFQEVGINEHQCYITNTTRCRPPGNRPPVASEFQTCMQAHGLKDFPLVRPKLILLMGAIPLKAILGLPKITERRGQFYDCDFFGTPTIKAFATFHPAAVLRKPALYQPVIDDLRRAKDFLLGTKGSTVLPNHQKVFIKDLDQLQLFVEFMEKHAPSIAVDLETTGLRFFRDRIASISFSFTLDDGTIVSVGVLTLPKPGWWHADIYGDTMPSSTSNSLVVRELFTRLLTNRKIRFEFHNGDFDTKMCWAAGFYVENGMDTIDAHLLLDENTSHRLKELVIRYISEQAGYQHKILDEVEDKAEISKAPPELLLDYNTDDTYATHYLAGKFEKDLREQGQWDFFTNHVMPVRRTFTRISYRGITIDRNRLLETSSRYRKKIQDLQKDLFSAVGKEFNWGSPDQLGAVLYDDLKLPILEVTKKGAPSTGKAVLVKLTKMVPENPVPDQIIQLKHLKKMISTYLDGDDGISGEVKGGMLQYLDANNRIHGDVLTHGTTSGRPSMKAPSLLTIPRDPDIRMNFMAPPGWLLIDCDYSQAELVMLAYLSGDPMLIEAVNSADMHTHTALTMMGLTQEEVNKETRTIAKTINFRKAYRGGGAGAAEVLRKTPEEAEELFRKWDQTYRLVPVWWQEQERLWRTKAVIEGIYGRRRHFPPAFDRKTAAYYDRLSANFPCQNGVADTTNRSLYMIDEALERIYGWSPETVYQVPGLVLSVHDAILAEAPEDIADDIRKLMVEIMSLPLPKIGISLKLDSKLVKRWGEENAKDKEAVVEQEQTDELREELRDDQRSF